MSVTVTVTGSLVHLSGSGIRYFSNSHAVADSYTPFKLVSPIRYAYNIQSVADCYIPFVVK
jgi:hypothetical protein